MKHIHHITPVYTCSDKRCKRRHVCGLDDPSNLIEVTREEHAELHKQLWLMNHNWQDEIAYLMLSCQMNKEPWNKNRKGLQKAWNKYTKGIMKPNKTSFKKGQKAWNVSGDPRLAFAERNSMSKEENRKKVSASKIGRKRIYKEDGTFYMSERVI